MSYLIYPKNIETLAGVKPIKFYLYEKPAISYANKLTKSGLKVQVIKCDVESNTMEKIWES